jgi:hypothetical protein
LSWLAINPAAGSSSGADVSKASNSDILDNLVMTSEILNLYLIIDRTSDSRGKWLNASYQVYFSALYRHYRWM